MSAGIIVLAIFIGLLIFFFLVTLHELGHFVIAKVCKAYVYEFSIGFGPRLFKIKGKETWFSVRLIPLGGFCSIASDKVDPPKGREEETENIPDERKLDYIARWKKMFFIMAGPLTNLIIAMFLFTTIFSLSLQKTNDMSFFGATYNSNQIAYNLIDKKFQEVNQSYVIWSWQVQETPYPDPANTNPAPAKIIFDSKNTINSSTNQVAVSYEKTVYNFIDNLKALQLSDPQKDVLQIRFNVGHVDKKTGHRLGEVEWTDWSEVYNPTTDKFDATKNFKIGDTIGISAPTRYFKNYWQGLGWGFKETFTTSISILKSFGTMIFTFNFSNLAGPVGLGTQIASTLSSANSFFINVAGFSANLFVLNLLIIPPLDGYRLVENFVEMAMKKEINTKVKVWIYVAGACLFLVLIVAVTIKDIIGLF